ncbi:hypothetical protein ACFL59_06240 [Planctomycetota bacterium]
MAEHPKEPAGQGDSLDDPRWDTADANSPQPLPDGEAQDPVPDEIEAYTTPCAPGPLGMVEALLKTPEALIGRVISSQFGEQLLLCTGIALFCHAVYGLIVGAYSGDVQWIAAPLKITGGTLLAVLICYPSLYIFSCLSGADIRHGQALALLGGFCALTSILLIGFAPIAFVFTVSIEALPFMGAVHLGVWLTSLWFGLRYLLRGISALRIETEAARPASGRRSTTLGGGAAMSMWVLILVATMLQMTTTLRPILGQSDRLLTSEKRFFLVHWWETMGESE